jgi:hypothetical protein
MGFNSGFKGLNAYSILRSLQNIYTECGINGGGQKTQKKVQRPNVAGTTTTTTTASSSSSSHVTTKLLLGSDYLCVSSHRDISVTVPYVFPLTVIFQ